MPVTHQMIGCPWIRFLGESFVIALCKANPMAKMIEAIIAAMEIAESRSIIATVGLGIMAFIDERQRSPSSRSDLTIEKTLVRELGCIGLFVRFAYCRSSRKGDVFATICSFSVPNIGKDQVEIVAKLCCQGAANSANLFGY